MTSLLRMKRPTTRRARITWTRTAASLLVCCLALGPTTSQAQELPSPALPTIDGLPFPSANLDAQAPVGRSIDFPVDRPPSANVSTAIFLNKPGSPSGIQQTTQFVTPPKERPEEPYDFSVALELPGPQRMFRRLSEKDFVEEIKLDYIARPGSGRAIFPESQSVSSDTYQKRQFPHIVKGVEPSYVLHGRLYFEQPNFERQGWDLGVLSPFVNMGTYYYDLALLPYHYMTRPFERVDTSAGKCLPGDPTPFYFYPEEFSLTGLVGQAAVVTGLFYLFP